MAPVQSSMKRRALPGGTDGPSFGGVPGSSTGAFPTGGSGL